MIVLGGYAQCRGRGQIWTLPIVSIAGRAETEERALDQLKKSCPEPEFKDHKVRLNQMVVMQGGENE